MNNFLLLRIGRLAVTAVFLLSLAPQLHAAELQVLSSGLFRGAFSVLIPQFERSSGHNVKLSYLSVADLKEKLMGANTADVAFVPSTIWPDLDKAGRVIAGSRAEIGSAYIAAVIRNGAPKPDLSSLDAVKRAIRSSKAVALNDPKSGSSVGRFILDSADRLAFDEELRSRIKLISGDGTSVCEAVLKGEADIGIAISSEIVPVKGVQIASPLPSELQRISLGYGALVVGTKTLDAGKELLKFLSSSEAKEVIKNSGLDVK